MQLKQDIKGFTLLELLVVVVLIGVLSAAGYPQFAKWSKDRKIRTATEKVVNILTSISTQAQKGYFPFVQLEVKSTATMLTFTSKSMAQDTMNDKLNQSATKLLDCKISNAGYWDNNEVEVFSSDELSVQFKNDTGAVCFSKDGSYFSEKGKLEDSSNANLLLDGKNTNNYIIICFKGSGSSGSGQPSSGTGMVGISGAGVGTGVCTTTPMYLVEWSRFGNIKKYRKGSGGWNRQ